MPRKPNRETTVERIYREVTGQKMPQFIKRILLHKAKFKLKPL
jgi:AraC-like DNA-binding protein